MRNALSVFDSSIAEARHLTALYQYLTGTVKAPYPFDDLLRSQIVYAVSAFDKLMHDLIRIAMVSCFSGNRIKTDRYQAEQISLQLHINLVSAIIPPKEIVFEQEVIKKLARFSFQDPDKVAEGLSLIWDEKHKWTKIATAMGQQDARTQLKLIADRRNAIVHESDRHPITHAKTPITVAECNNVTDFVQACGRTIANLVI